jgi:type IV pilus assembly protein PilF
MDQAVIKRYLPLCLLLIGLNACANTARLQEQAGTHIGIGSAYLGSGQYNAALKELLQAEKLTPEDPRVHYLLGISYHGRGLDDRAIAEFQQTIALKPDDSAAHNYLGVVYLETGRWNDAIASFKRALANILYDTPAATLFNMGRAYYEMREYDLALKHYQDAAAGEPETVIMPLIEKNMGMAYLAKRDAAEAVRHLRKSISLAPSLAESHYWLALCYRELNKPDDAVKSFQTAVRLAPDSEFGRKAGDQLKTLTP